MLISNHKKELSHAINNHLSDDVIESLARETNFIKRSRKIPAHCFVNTLMFAEYDQSNVSLPDLTADLNQVYDIDVSKEAMHKKFTPDAVIFLQQLLNKLLSQQLQLHEENNLQHHFPRIKIKDSTKFALPDNYNKEYAGYNNFSKKNGLMCLQYE